jgi:hypothetical protein
MMCELPTNALLAEQFLEHFDGFSIGSNDLTQLTLGLDRDSGIVSHYLMSVIQQLKPFFLWQFMHAVKQANMLVFVVKVHQITLILLNGSWNKVLNLYHLTLTQYLILGSSLLKKRSSLT